MKDRIEDVFRQSAQLQESFLARNREVMESVIAAVAGVLKKGNKLLIFGNGGSAADAQHLAAEFVNRYILDRPPLAAIALTTDTSVMSSIANDFSFNEVFEKQVRALGKGGDAALGISTSGRSPNVVRALETAQRMGLITVGLGGPAGSPMELHCTYYFAVEGASTPRIQEVHQLVLHTLVEMVDLVLFGEAKT